MATHDYVIANGTGAAVRSDLNDALAAIVSNNSGSSEPATTYAFQWWADTTANVLKIRNSANNGWITLRELDGTLLIEDGTEAAPSLSFATDLNTGLFRSAENKLNISAGGAERLEIGSSEVVFNDPSNDVDFRVESNGQTHMLFVDAGNDRVGIGTSSPGVLVDAAGSNPTLRVRATTSNTEVSTLRLTEDNSYVGAYVKYDGSTNLTHIGTHSAADSNSANDNNAITIVRDNRRVGIGTTSPAYNLSVESTSGTSINIKAGTASTARLRFGDSGDDDIGQIIYDNGGNSMRFHTNAAERFRVDSSGNFAIGTSSPTSKFDVEVATNTGINFTNISTAPIIDFKANSVESAGRIRVNEASGGGVMQFATKTTGGTITEAIRIDSSQNVNIGSNISSNPFTYLRFGASQHGAADIRPTNEGSHKVGLSFYTDGTQDTTINPTEAMRLDSSGHLQIRREGVASMSGVDTRHTRYVIRQTNGQEAILGSVFAQGKSGWGGDLVFASKSATGSPSTGLTERMRLLAGGGITFNGDTAAANALDDYEEGSWTPASHNNFNNISSPEGRYIKVGKLVTVNFQFNYGSLNSATAASGIDGLPYSVANDNSLTGVEATGIGFGTNKDVIIWGEGGADIIYFKVGSPLNGSTSSGADFFRGSLTYLTD